MKSRIRHYRINREIGAFMSYYSEDFTAPYNPEMADYDTLRRSTIDFFGEYPEVEIFLTDMEEVVESESTALMSVKQRCRCPGSGYDEFGDKLFKWKNVEGEWLIYFEQWWELPS